ncbi:MAG: sigma-70 family RNA polymerase sigma factor [Cellvibrionaceae bacterium]
MQRRPQQILDEWLVACSQAGDAKAFQRLLQRWQPRLIAYAQRQLGDREGAADVAQDTMLAIASNLKKLKDPAAFPKWAYQILHRNGCNWVGRQQRQRRDDAVLMQVEEPATLCEEDSLLRAALYALDSEHYHAIRLFYLEGFTLNEIAQITDIPLGTAKSRLFNARQKLKEFIEGDGNE